MKLNTKQLAAFALLTAATTATASIGFDNLSFASGFNFENGAHLSGTETVENRFGFDVTVRRSTFTAGEGGFTADFDNEYIVEWDSWSSWAYSKDTDTVTSGFGNQYSAITGSGSRGSSNYGISFGNTTIRFSAAQDFTGRGFDVTNTTYAHNSMRDGDGFAKQFGGASGDDPDFFVLVVEGFLGGSSTGTVDFYLADYRFADNAQDYILSDWAFVDLSVLGTIDELAFDLNSSDSGGAGMNTPDYFAIDHIGAVPEPSAFALLAGAMILGIVGLRRRRG